MSNLYPLIKLVHVSCVGLSLTGFVARWLLTLADSPWMARRWVRVLPHVIDTVLLASAITLAVISGVAPWRDAWLGAKVAGLLVYIALGMLALRRARSRTSRALAGVAAILVFLYVVSVALARSPLGPWR